MTTIDQLARRLRIAPWQRNRLRELELYLEDRGPDALQRQVQLTIDNYPCCWQPRSGEHHPSCRAGERA